MKGHVKSTAPKRRNAGIGLVTAVFLLVVLSSLAAALVTLFTSQQVSSSLDEQGARAYQAARAGAEWALWKTKGTQPSCPASPTTFGFAGNTSLAGFSVTVTCTQVNFSTGAFTITRFIITAVACNQAGTGGCPNPSNKTGYVQRRVEVEV